MTLDPTTTAAWDPDSITDHTKFKTNDDKQRKQSYDPRPKTNCEVVKFYNSTLKIQDVMTNNENNAITRNPKLPLEIQILRTTETEHKKLTRSQVNNAKTRL